MKVPLAVFLISSRYLVETRNDPVICQGDRVKYERYIVDCHTFYNWITWLFGEAK